MVGGVSGSSIGWLPWRAARRLGRGAPPRHQAAAQIGLTATAWPGSTPIPPFARLAEARAFAGREKLTLTRLIEEGLALRLRQDKRPLAADGLMPT